MPKKFNDNEKEYIVKRLKEEALKCIMTYGIKKTTVDELVKRVNIPKGTFYLFYESKELLLFDAINDIHELVQKKMLEELATLSQGITVDLLTEVLFKLYKEVNDTGLLSIMMNSDLELLVRKLPESVVKEHALQDDLSVEQLLAFLPHKKELDTNAFSGALRGVFLTMLHRREIGEEIFDDAMRLMLRGLIIQMMEE